MVEVTFLRAIGPGTGGSDTASSLLSATTTAMGGGGGGALLCTAFSMSQPAVNATNAADAINATRAGGIW